jgi:ABC-type branched-subunit amino acid transport system ATPase component
VQGKHLGDFEAMNDPENPHALLVELMEELVRLGFMSQQQRLGAEMAAWSMVHGLAMLLIDGPLAGLPKAERGAVVEQTLTTFTQSFWNARAGLRH